MESKPQCQALVFPFHSRRHFRTPWLMQIPKIFTYSEPANLLTLCSSLEKFMGSTCGSFLRGFPTKILHVFLISLRDVTRPNHPVIRDIITVRSFTNTVNCDYLYYVIFSTRLLLTSQYESRSQTHSTSLNNKRLFLAFY